MPKQLRKDIQALQIELECLRELERLAEVRRLELLRNRELLNQRIEEAKRIQEMSLVNRELWGSVSRSRPSSNVSP